MKTVVPGEKSVDVRREWDGALSRAFIREACRKCDSSIRRTILDFAFCVLTKVKEGEE